MKWDLTLTDSQGNSVRIGFFARTAIEPGPDQHQHLVARAMNWRAELKGPAVTTDDLAQRTLRGLAQAGVHRAFVGLVSLRLPGDTELTDAGLSPGG